MSATAGSAPAPSRPKSERAWSNLFLWAVIAVDAAILTAALVSGSVHLSGRGPELVIWALLAAVAGSLTVSAGEARLGFDLPVVLGAGLVFGPLVAGLLAAIAVLDMREFRHDVPFWVGVFNRAEISLSAMAGAAAFRSTGVSLGDWPWTAVAGVLALAVDAVVNYALVATFWAIKSGRPLRVIISEMRFGPAESFIPVYACFGFVGVLIAEAYLRLGILGVVGFVAPVLIARQAFAHRQSLDAAIEALSNKSRALTRIDEEIAKERRDERMALAGELHDEVLPPLFQVHLMGQVLRQDLISGRLLDLDEDLPQLLAATETAQTAIRDLVRNLRRSSLGAGGLAPTLRLLARQLESSGSPRITFEIEETRASYQCQLLAYQVAREALTNAAKYSRAEAIDVRLTESDDLVRVVVSDDGVGFDPVCVDRTEHFGLQLIAERVQSAGGNVVIDSRLGNGTTVAATIPASL